MPKRVNKAKTPEGKLKKALLESAMIDLNTAVVWLSKGDTTWASVNIRRAVKLLDAAMEL
jgi:hypothetical protein